MSEKSRVLFVDDDRNVLRFYSAVFSKAGFETEACANLTAMRQCLNEEEFDAVFLDLNLGEENGLDGIPYVNDLAPLSKVFVLTSQEVSKMKDKCLQKGANWFFKKGNDPQKIVSKVKEFLEDSSAHS
jgi:DNA-binding NtrC family response regulator